MTDAKPIPPKDWIPMIPFDDSDIMDRPLAKYATETGDPYTDDERQAFARRSREQRAHPDVVNKT